MRRRGSISQPRDKARREELPQSLPGQLEESQQRCAELYDSAPIGYVTLDRQGLIRDINLPAVALLGVERQHAIGLPFRVFVGKAHRAALAAHLMRFFAAGDAVSELRLQARRSGPLDVELRSRRTLDGPHLCFTSIVDLSGQRRAEQERLLMGDAERAAREASSAKDHFIASLSHELRSPLAPVLVAVSTLKSGQLPLEELGRLCEIIRRNVRIEARLIDDLLDVSRIAANKLEIERHVTDLHQIALSALEMFTDELRAKPISVNLDLEAARHHVRGDAARLRQVFANLIKNAARFTPAGGTLALRSWNKHGAVVVEVSDSGEGIEEHALARIFNRFEQAHVPATGAAGGLGLGLAICKGIVDLHGGHVVAHSPGLGRGSRFLVELATADAVAETEAPRAERHAPKRAPLTKKARILIVEDEPDLSAALTMLLQAEGYEVVTAANARAALGSDLEKVSVMISDLGLPDLDGRELLRKLHAKHDVKAIALSGYGTEADVRASENAGFLRHLTKPVELDELLGAIEVALGPKPANNHNGALAGTP